MTFGEGIIEFKITFTTRCSGNCTTCLNPQIKKHFVLDKDLFESIVMQICQLDIPNEILVSFYSIGESFLHPDYVEMCEWAIPILHDHGIKTMIVTNGTHVHRIPRGIDTFVISFNAGKKETYERVTGIKYELVCNNIFELQDKKEFEKANDVQIHMLCFDENDGEEKDFLNQFNSLKGVKYRMRYGYDNQYGSTSNKGRSEQYKLELKRVPCSYVTNIITIYPNGDVVRCCHDFFDKYTYGNIKDNSLLNIIESEERKAVFRDHLNGVFSDICSKCDLNRSTLKEEFVYGYFDEECDSIYRSQLLHKNDYYYQLANSVELIERIRDEKIFLWGYGKRGRAFEKVCHDNNVEISYKYDKKTGDEASLSSYIENSSVIIASNFNIYSMMMYTYPDVIDKTVNLERYCPL